MITAGVLLSGSSAVATPKSPAKLQAARPTIQLTQAPISLPIAQTNALSTEILQNVPTVSGALADGVYFFGAVPERDQLGAEYMVFQVNDEQVVGAFYLPASNFDCFHGQVQPDMLALSITDSYDQAVHAYNLAMETVPTTVAGSGAGTFGPAGFYSLGQPGELEQELLGTCQANYVDAI